MDGEFLKTHAVVQVFWTCVCVTCVIVVCRWRPSFLIASLSPKFRRLCTAKRIVSLVFATHPYTQVTNNTTPIGQALKNNTFGG